jgi:nicotinamide phosphoribosyltransferase
MLDEAEDFSRQVFGQEYFNRKGWQHIIDKHGGRLPILIKAVPEGMVVPVRNVLMTIENTYNCIRNFISCFTCFFYSIE